MASLYRQFLEIITNATYFPFDNNSRTVQEIVKSKLFDIVFYRWKYNLDIKTESEGIRHYLTSGWRASFDPHPLFKTTYYISQTGPIEQPALLHYLRYGYLNKLNPHPLFDVDYYHRQRPDVWNKRTEPLRHYLEYGANENSNPSPYFDERYYKIAYPHVAQSGMNCLIHYVTHGDREGLNPSLKFITSRYLAANPDLVLSDIGALGHYILHGKAEGRPLQPPPAGRNYSTARASISVVIPTYNRSDVLRETVEQCQHHSKDRNIEFIIINDGSRDDTGRVLEELTERYNNITYRTIENGGPGRARNIGACLATKEVILFIGDDIRPTNSDFFDTHARLHKTHLSDRFAVLGKCVWPNNKSLQVNHVMRHIQGRGGEQFGYADLVPYSFIDWRFFYTANVSVKNGVIDDWETEGFSPKFDLAAFEDAEFAYRLTLKSGGFTIFYDPTSVGHHIHPYTVEGFLRRQFNTGLMADVFLKLHNITEQLGLQPIANALRAPSRPDDGAVVADCLAILEGIMAWVRLLDRDSGLGNEAWHDDLLYAVFEASYYHGFISAQTRFDANLASAYQYVLRSFMNRMRRSIHHELAGSAFIEAALFGPIAGNLGLQGNH